MYTIYLAFIAFQNKPSLSMSDAFQLSPAWVLITWESVTRATDRDGAIVGLIVGYFITYQVICIQYNALYLFAFMLQRVTAKRNVDSGNINVTSNSNSANLTDLVQGSRYEISLSAYTDGFVLGPPSSVTINTPSYSMC